MGAELAELEKSLRDTLRSSTLDAEKRKQKALEIQRQAWDQTKQVRRVPSDLSTPKEVNEKELIEKVKKVNNTEEEINRRKQEVQQRVNAQFSRVELEAKRLEDLRRELNALEDPTKKEIGELRKKIEIVEKELKPLKAICDKKEKELKEAVAFFNDKNAQKTELVGRLFEIVTESERVRMAKLEELNRYLQAMEARANV